MQIVIRTIGDKTICILIEIFFILSFIFLSYKYNIYIVWGLIPFFILINKAVYKSALFYIILLIAVSLIYYYYSSFSSAFRAIKTMVVFLPFFFTNILQRERFSLSKSFYVFMQLNAALVCIDFCLFFITGRTIMSFTESAFLPRPCGLLEDSNFFSYLMVVCIFYYKWNCGRYNRLFVVSLFLSGSFSAICSFLVLFNVFKRKCTEDKCSTKFKFMIASIALIIIFIYAWLAMHSDVILNYISELQMNDLLKVKMASLTQRFAAVSNAMSEIDTVGEFVFGMGAGKTRELSEAGRNLHNSFLQMFLEMGGSIVCIVFLIVVAMLYHIQTTKYVVLFCTILVLGCIMETVYNPLLVFVYFLSFSNKYDGISKI